METILAEADRLVSSDRQNDYGHPYDDFSKTAAMWTVILGTEVKPEQIPLCMIAVKLSRQVNKPKRDNLVDIAGYAKTADMVLERIKDMHAKGEEYKDLVARVAAKKTTQKE